jgi:acyl phosphate:glycerol-3-phosphate acyltransferase
MNNMVLIFMAGAYLIGSIPFAVLISKLKFGTDIRTLGSGNAGATNMARNFGKKAGLLTLFLDVLKGCAAPFFFLMLNPSANLDRPDNHLSLFLISYATGLGHIFPIFAQFKGGKGVATLLGSMLLIQPQLALLGIVCFLAVLLLTEFVSLSSMVAAVLFAALFSFKNGNQLASIAVWGFPLLFVFSHRTNIQRLMQGVENKTILLKKK